MCFYEIFFAGCKSTNKVRVNKDGSWNSMISAHINRQIFANIGMSPYRFLGEEGSVRKEPYFLIVNPF